MSVEWYQGETLSRLKSLSKTPLFWSVLCLVFIFFSFKDVALPCYYGSPDYLNVEAGQGIKYQVTDDGNSLNCSIWAVSRSSGEDGFVFTLTQNGSDGGPFCNSWLRGGYSSDYSSYIFNAGCPAGIQSDLYALLSIPEAFEPGDQWLVLDREYLIEVIGEYSVNGTLFYNCIRVTVDNTQDSNELLRGSGYFILAGNIGVVQMVFNREDGSTVLFEYQDQGMQTLYKLCGRLSSTTGGSVEGLVVQLSNCDDAGRCELGMNGTFSIHVYGPDVVLRVGYDDDGDGTLDPDQPPNYPQEFHVNCESGVVTTLASDIALEVVVGEDCDLNDVDEDGVPDEDDNCLTTPNADQANSDSDPFGDACDNCPQVANGDQIDSDEDGIGNVCDNCWETANPDQLDSDDTCDTPPYEMNPVCGDACEVSDDGDGDGVADEDDNCPDVPNADQADSDGDSSGDSCDNCPDFSNSSQTDSDEDGIGDTCDSCWEVPNPEQLDADGDCFAPPYRSDPACGDACDLPFCGNDVREGEEVCDGTDMNGETCESQGHDDDWEEGVLTCLPDCSGFDTTLCEIDDDDSDGDGIENEVDNCPSVANSDQSDSDGDSIGDACDNCPDNSNRNQVDVDDDGIGNACDNCLMVPNADQADSDGSCYAPPFRSDPVCGDACESPREIVVGVLLSTIDLENEVEENIMDGDITEVTEDIEDSSWKLDYILGVFVKAWEAGELNNLPSGKVRMAWIALKVARNLNQMAVKMLERDQLWRRRGARVLMQLSLYCNQYVKGILE
jgi:hypothetical protein